MKLEVKTVNLTRLFNKALILNNLKRFWWVSLLYTIGLFLLSPVLVLSKEKGMIEFETIFDGTIFFLFIVPVFLAVMVFRYMQNSKSMVTVHAMPYNRLDLYVNNVISGLILLIVPILLNSALLSYLQLSPKEGIIFEQGISIKYLWISLLVSITLYAITVAVGMVTGSSIAQIIFTYIINFLPAGIVVILHYLFDGIIYGFSGISQDVIAKLAKISPIVQTLYLRNQGKISDFLIPDIILIIAVLVIGYFLYKYRNLEDAGEVISGKFIKPIFKYGVTVCVMLVGALYVKEIFEVDSPDLIIYLLFALLGYAVAEMLLRKSFKILNSYKGFIGFIGVFAIVVACINFDLLGYEKYVPKADDIECFTFGSTWQIEVYKQGIKTDVLTSKENIEKVVALNQDIIKNKNANMSKHGEMRFTYLLKNGKTVSRLYRIDRASYEERVREIMQSEEYKKSQVELFKRNIEEIDNIKVSNYVFSDHSVAITTKEEIAQLVSAMEQDILSSNYNLAHTSYNYSYGYLDVDRDDFLYSIRIMYKEKNSNGKEFYSNETLYFDKNSVNVSNFIEKNASSVIIKAEEIKMIEFYNQEREISKTVKEPSEIESTLNDIVYRNFREVTVMEEGSAEMMVTAEISFKDGKRSFIEVY